MTVTIFHRQDCTAHSIAVGTSTVASHARSMSTRVRQAICSINSEYSNFTPSPSYTLECKTAESLTDRNDNSPDSQSTARFGSVLLLGLSLLLGAVQTANAGTLIFTFADDGSNSTITPSGSLDLTDFYFVRNIGLHGTSEIGMPDILGSYLIPQWPDTITGTTLSNKTSVEIVGASTFSGKNGLTYITTGSSYVSDFRFYVSKTVRGAYILAEDKDMAGDTLDFSGRGASFNGTLADKLGDNDFHIEVVLHDQHVVFTTETEKPAKPVDLTAIRGDNTVTLNWSDPKNSKIWRYQYQYKAMGSDYGEWTDMDPSDATTTSHTIEGLSNGEIYTFRIRAVNFLGNGPASDEATVIPLVPGAPDAAVLTASAVKRTAVLTWTHAGDTSITKWQYQQREGDTAFGGEWKDIPDSDATTRQYTVDNLTGGLAYGFRVRAVNDAGNGVVSNIATVGTPKGPSPEMEHQAARVVLSEIGRTTLAGATEIIDDRLQSTQGTSTLMLGGQLVGGEASMKDPVADHEERGWWLGNRALEGHSSSIEDEQLLGGSAFTLSLSGEDAVDGNTGITVWGRGDFRNFQGVSGSDSWDGSVKSAWVGIDNWANERLLAGVAVSRNRGEVDLLTLDVNSRVETSLTAVWPYMQMTLPSGTGTVRVVLGIGSGEAEHRPEEGEDSKAGMSLKAASVGARWALANQGQVTISVPVEAEVVQLRTRGDASTAIGGLSIKSWRVRSGVEVAHTGLALSDSGWVLLPRGSLSLRQDGGDGITGRGVEVGGGLGLYSPASRMSLDASGHWLARHSATGQREWGASIGVQFAPDSKGHGWSGSLRQEWGAQQAEALSDNTIFQFGDGGTIQAPGSLAAKAGYGFGVMEGLLTLSADARLSTGQEEVPHYGAGLEFTLPRGLTATLRGEHVDAMNPDTHFGAGVHLQF